jgi:tRNA pseudouridine38-40 synthase
MATPADRDAAGRALARRETARSFVSDTRLRLVLGYDGTGFAGWAAQPEQRTVEGELARVLEVMAGRPVAMTVAGRTDAGVHARAQVLHVDVPAHLAPELRLRGLNGLLPPDIRVHSVGPAAAGFDARFSALARVYGYRVTDQTPDPLRRLDTLAWVRPLDVSLLQAASDALLGLNDFAAYCRAREGRTTLRTLQRLEWIRDSDGVLLAIVQADAFCHSMVRSLVGALLPVGDGRWPVDRPASLLGAERRSDAVVVAPAHGLTLLEVRYPPDGALAARANETRRMRTPSV